MKYLLIDCSSILHPLKYTLGDSDPSEGRIVEGFFKKVLELSKKFSTKDIIFCWDESKAGFVPYRKRIYPAYKKDVDQDGNIIEEEKTQEEIEFDLACYEQFDLVKKMVDDMGFRNSFGQAGCEADDVLAKICSDDNNNFHDFILCTNDEDMFDCLKYENVKCFMLAKKKMVTKRLFIEEKNIDPTRWNMVKAIGGCKSDKVPSPKGVAEKTAIKYLNGELKETSKAYQSIKDFPKDKRIRNKRLVTIPIPQTKSITLLEENNISMEKFVKYCYGKGMGDFLNETMDQWDRFFENRFTSDLQEKRKRAEERRANKRA